MRPHYHLLVFGHEFADKIRCGTRNGYPIYRSPILEDIWKKGTCEIGDVTYASAMYVAQYTMKKVTGKIAKQFYDGLEPEFAQMSRRPAVGKTWFEKYGDETYPNDNVWAQGKLTKPPRYYDKLYEREDPDGYNMIKRRRRESHNPGDATEERLATREAVALAKFQLKQ